MCNMTIHPLFKEGRLLNSFMKLANHQLEDNGILTGVAIDGDKVMRLFVNREEINRGLYRLESLIDLEESKTPYGNDFELEVKGKKAIRHYTVTISELKEVAENNSFLFIGTMDFPAWFQKYQEKKYEALSKEQKEFAFLHFSYFFKKRELKN